MKVITTKLKRYRAVCYIICIIFSPITIPTAILFRISEILSNVLEDIWDIIYNFRYKVICKVADVFKFEEIARQQREINKDKFK